MREIQDRNWHWVRIRLKEGEEKYSYHCWHPAEVDADEVWVIGREYCYDLADFEIGPKLIAPPEE